MPFHQIVPSSSTVLIGIRVSPNQQLHQLNLRHLCEIIVIIVKNKRTEKIHTVIHSFLTFRHFFPYIILMDHEYLKQIMCKVEMNYDKAKSHKEFEDYSTKTASNMYLRVKTEKRIRKMLVPAPAAAPRSGARGRLEAATTHHFSGAARAAAALYQQPQLQFRTLEFEL